MVDVGPAVAMNPSIIVAIVGAESTGKSQLAQALAERLQVQLGQPSIAVDEWLRTWCEREGRTPRREEQWAIAQEQSRRIEAAAREHAVVVADTTALMTAVYSEWLFRDRSLRASAQALHRRYALTLVTANDLPWQADGLQRDGPCVREPVRSLTLEMLQQAGATYAEVAGSGPDRLHCALRLVTAHLAPAGGAGTAGAAATAPTWTPGAGPNSV
jgi:nicotinamide riboside kinase